MDYRSGAYSYLQHLDENGNPELLVNGVIIDTLLNYPILISNIDSGACLMHFGAINFAHNRSLTRIDKSGNILWSKLVPAIYGNNFYIKNNQLLSDKVGGVFLAWDENNYGNDVVSQHIDKNGNFLWGQKGIPVSNQYGSSQINPQLTNDNFGGILVSWDDFPDANGIYSGDIYAQRVSSDATLYGKSGLYNTIKADTNVLVGTDATYIRISECGTHVTWQSSLDTINFISLYQQWSQSDTFLLVTGINDTSYYRAIIDEPYACFDTTEIIKIIPYPEIINDFQLFPNPFVDYANLYINLSIDIVNAEVRIYDMVGKEAYSYYGIKNHALKIETGNLTKGVYIIQLWNNSQLIGSDKFIIK